jgi:hypothetical protein
MVALARILANPDAMQVIVQAAAGGSGILSLRDPEVVQFGFELSGLNY